MAGNAINQKSNPWGNIERVKYLKFALSALDAIKSTAETELLKESANIGFDELSSALRKIGDAHKNLTEKIRLVYSK